MEDFFYREMIKYLKLAEERRRWNLFKDIPWQEVNFNTSNALAECVETFGAVEMYLPDFTSKMLHMVRRSRGRAWFHVNWGYEESKHSLTLETWLLASAHRTEAERKAFEEALLGQEWELPFDHPRQMVCYTMIQELATFWNYRNLEQMAITEGDFALVAALRLISVDERVHYHFYRSAVKEWMRHDDRGTVEDLKYVFDNFTMPGRAQIPGYDDRSRVLAKTGIYGPREYVKLVKNPVLEDLGLDKEYHRMEKREAEAAQREQARTNALKREQIVLGNGHAVPRNSSPTNGLPERVPLLEAVGMKPGQIQVLHDIAVQRDKQDDGSGLRGSRGMPNLTPFDLRLMAIGDELSNNPEELRDERRKIRKNRMKNDRLRRVGGDESGSETESGPR